MLFNKMNNLGFCCTLLLIVQELLKSSALSSGHARLDFVSWKWIEDFGVEIWDSSRRQAQLGSDGRAGERPLTAGFGAFPKETAAQVQFHNKTE